MRTNKKKLLIPIAVMCMVDVKGHEKSINKPLLKEVISAHQHAVLFETCLRS